jgi:hypothetical protein
MFFVFFAERGRGGRGEPAVIQILGISQYPQETGAKFALTPSPPTHCPSLFSKNHLLHKACVIKFHVQIQYVQEINNK